MSSGFFYSNNFKLLFFILLYKTLSSTITLLGSCDTPGLAQGVTVVNDVAYVADGTGLEIIDVTNPSNPTLMSSYATPMYALGVAVVNDIAYVADQLSGLQIIEVIYPSNPTLIDYCDTPGIAEGVAVINDFAYVADSLSGLQIIDVSNPSNPILIGYYDTTRSARGVTVINDIAYVADLGDGIQIINVSNPYSPTLIGNYDTYSEALGVIVINDIAYVADWDGLSIINVTNPSNPTLIGNYTTPGVAYGVTVDHHIAYVAAGTSGLQILNVTNPYNITLISNYDTPGDAWGVTVVNDIVYVADKAGGLQIIQFQYYTPSDSFTISMVAITSFSITMILIFIIIKSKLLWFYEANYDIFYLLFPLLGIINIITDILFIIYLSLIRYHFLSLIISSFIFILSIILNYFRTSKWRKLFKTQENSIDFIHYLSKNQTVFDNIVNLSVIHPAILLILKSNYKDKDCFKFPSNDSSISIPIQCILYDLYSLIPQSVFICLIAIEDTPSEWNIILWIIILFKLLNLMISFSRIFTVLYSGGGKSTTKLPLKYGVFKTVKTIPSPNLISTSDSSIEITESSNNTSTGSSSIEYSVISTN